MRRIEKGGRDAGRRTLVMGDRFGCILNRMTKVQAAGGRHLSPLHFWMLVCVCGFKYLGCRKLKKKQNQKNKLNMC